MTKRASKRPKAVPKKVAAPLRLSPSAAKRHFPVSGIEVEADVALLVHELGAMIDDARKQVRTFCGDRKLLLFHDPRPF